MEKDPDYVVSDSTISTTSKSSYYKEDKEIIVTPVKIDEKSYTMNKPRRIIIRAKIIND